MKIMARTVAVLLALCCAAPAFAADHIDSPAATADQAADITDFFAWHTEGGKLILIMSVAGAGATTDSPTLDPEVLYAFHIDNDANNEADVTVYFRYAQDGDGNWGVQATQITTASEDQIVGPVGEMVGGDEDGFRTWTGVSDDAFFFDFQGYNETLETGTLAFDPARDFFAGLNVTTIALEMDLATATGGGETLQVWATTGRL